MRPATPPKPQTKCEMLRPIEKPVRPKAPGFWQSLFDPSASIAYAYKQQQYLAALNLYEYQQSFLLPNFNMETPMKAKTYTQDVQAWQLDFCPDCNRVAHDAPVFVWKYLKSGRLKQCWKGGGEPYLTFGKNGRAVQKGEYLVDGPYGCYSVLKHTFEKTFKEKKNIVLQSKAELAQDALYAELKKLVNKYDPVANMRRERTSPFDMDFAEVEKRILRSLTNKQGTWDELRDALATGRIEFGIDLARPGGDMTVFAIRKGKTVRMYKDTHKSSEAAKRLAARLTPKDMETLCAKFNAGTLGVLENESGKCVLLTLGTEANAYTASELYNRSHGNSHLPTRALYVRVAEALDNVK